MVLLDNFLHKSYHHYHWMRCLDGKWRLVEHAIQQPNLFDLRQGVNHE